MGSCVCCRTLSCTQQRPGSIHEIIHGCSKEGLMKLLKGGWDVNEIIYPQDNSADTPRSGVMRTALCEAARRGWTEGVRMLLDAGAKCKINDGLGSVLKHGTECIQMVDLCTLLDNPLTLALQNADCPVDLIKLLLEHGADPNYHDHRLETIPLLFAVTMCRHSRDIIEIVELLLEYGADPNVMVKRFSLDMDLCPLLAVLSDAKIEVVVSITGEPETVLSNKNYDPQIVQNIVKSNDHHDHLSVAQRQDVSATLFNALVQHGANVNYYVDRREPLLHNLITQRDSNSVHYRFSQQQLDLFFQYGGNINMEDGEHGTALERAVTYSGHSNSIRWLIRHGADTLTKFPLLKGHLIYYALYPETPLLLLQAGMRVSHGAQTQLSNMETAITAWLQDNTTGYDEHLQDMWEQLEKAEELEQHKKQHNFRKVTFREYWSRQLDDLQDFSDESLQAYPEVDTHRSLTWQENSLDQIHRVLEFLSQPQSLHWYCRRCVRENLVSLQPSVVKTLPGPVGLKRYILCHEI